VIRWLQRGYSCNRCFNWRGRFVFFQKNHNFFNEFTLYGNSRFRRHLQLLVQTFSH
jgi:hypothetical protein